MQKFFLHLLKANGAILLILALVILVQIWLTPIEDKAMFGKIVGSYLVVILNFVVLSSVLRSVEKLDNKKGRPQPPKK